MGDYKELSKQEIESEELLNQWSAKKLSDRYKIWTDRCKKKFKRKYIKIQFIFAQIGELNFYLSPMIENLVT